MTTTNKKSELDAVLVLLKLDYTKQKIRKKLGIKPSALANRLRRLEDLGCIERQGKYLIKVLRSSHINPEVTKNQIHKKLNKRGHAFNFKIYFPKEGNLLEKSKVKHELKVGNLETLSFGSAKLVKDKCTIWINKNGTLTIYSNNSYYSKDALHSKFRQLKDMDNLVIYLKDRFGFSGIYGIEIFREHYGLIFNKFAKWINKRGEKMFVKDKGNKSILWVDKSRKDDIGLDEFEGDDPTRINASDKLFDSHEKTGWKVTPEHNLKHQAETNKQIEAIAIGTKQNADHLEFHAENMRSHVGAIRELKTGVNDLRIENRSMREEREKTNLLLGKLTNLIESKM